MTRPASPCISLCKMHQPTGWCEGCLRTLDEIAGWGSLDAEGQRAILAALPSRRVAWKALQASRGPEPATTSDSTP